MNATKQIKFLTYNVWSREDVMVYKRMLAIGALVEKHDPDVIFFQEVTPYIRSIFEDLPWWKKYHCSQEANRHPFCLLLSKLPLENVGRWKFANSPTRGGYLEADISPDPASTMKPIRIATTQLERPSPPAPMRCAERYAQAEHAVAELRSAENVVFGGDMCWRDGTDRPFPLPAGWFDAWPAWQDVIRPYRGTVSCWTYDRIWEEEVLVFNDFAASHESMMHRSDRFVCKLKDYSLKGMELIGGGIDDYTDPVSLYTNLKRDYNYNGHTLRKLDSILLRPSCHRGLLMTIAPNLKEPPRSEVPPPPPAPAPAQWMESWEDSD